MTPPALTPTQQQVLATIRAYVEQRGYPPSVREIGAAAGLRSVSSVVHQLGQLVAKGYLRRDPSRSRAIQVIDPTETEESA